MLLLVPGDQIVIDGTVLWSDGLEIDESLPTGEAEPVGKKTGDEVLSGSCVAVGSAPSGPPGSGSSTSRSGGSRRCRERS